MTASRRTPAFSAESSPDTQRAPVLHLWGEGVGPGAPFIPEDPMCSSKKPDPPKKVAAAPALPAPGAQNLRGGSVRQARRQRSGGTDMCCRPYGFHSLRTPRRSLHVMLIAGKTARGRPMSLWFPNASPTSNEARQVAELTLPHRVPPSGYDGGQLPTPSSGHGFPRCFLGAAKMLWLSSRLDSR